MRPSGRTSLLLVAGAIAAVVGASFGGRDRGGRNLAAVATPPRGGDTRFPPTIRSQGLTPIGAAGGSARAVVGRGVTVAILDMGFGDGWPSRAARGELPPPTAIERRSFDARFGLTGRNLYGHPTTHGEILAQTVYDYAPAAKLIFVNYNTRAEFVAAADWLAKRRPDIVVHSNNFMEGPFDGTSDIARAVDRVAAAGPLWVNSAGNYSGLAWSGRWSDANRDGFLDWPYDPAWTFSLERGAPITFALTWVPQPDESATRLALVLERQGSNGAWATFPTTTDAHGQAGESSDRIIDQITPTTGRYRLRVALRGGPPPRTLTLLSKEVPLKPILGGVAGPSIPTPADAAGALSVGALDWATTELKAYSGRGPTLDGRPKPEVVAGTGTLSVTKLGLKAYAGTSNAAPNAGGLAAALLWGERGAGLTPTAGRLREDLVASAVDMGPAGTDSAYGAGRLALDAVAPRITAVTPAPGAEVAGRFAAGIRTIDGTDLFGWTLSLDRDVRCSSARSPAGQCEIDGGGISSGAHRLTATAMDWAGNVDQRTWTIRASAKGGRGGAWANLPADRRPLPKGWQRTRPGRTLQIEARSVRLDADRATVRYRVTNRLSIPVRSVSVQLPVGRAAKLSSSSGATACAAISRPVEQSETRRPIGRAGCRLDDIGAGQSTVFDITYTLLGRVAVDVPVTASALPHGPVGWWQIQRSSVAVTRIPGR